MVLEAVTIKSYAQTAWRTAPSGAMSTAHMADTKISRPPSSSFGKLHVSHVATIGVLKQLFKIKTNTYAKVQVVTSGYIHSGLPYNHYLRPITCLTFL